MKAGRRLRSVRVRLTLAYVGAMMAVIAVYGAVVYFSVQGNLSQGLDDKLRGDLSWPSYMMTKEMVEKLLRGENFDETVAEGSPWLQVWSENGKKLLGRTNEARVNLIPEAEALAKVADGKIRRLPDTPPPRRILTERLRWPA